jgi:hypothetical protein
MAVCNVYAGDAGKPPVDTLRMITPGQVGRDATASKQFPALSGPFDEWPALECCTFLK